MTHERRHYLFSLACNVYNIACRRLYRFRHSHTAFIKRAPCLLFIYVTKWRTEIVIVNSMLLKQSCVRSTKPERKQLAKVTHVCKLSIPHYDIQSMLPKYAIKVTEMKFWLWGVFFCICTVIILHNIKSCVSVKLIKRKIHLYDI